MAVWPFRRGERGESGEGVRVEHLTAEEPIYLDIGASIPVASVPL